MLSKEEITVLLQGSDKIARDRDNQLFMSILKIILEIEKMDSKEARINSIETFMKVLKEEIDKLKEQERSDKNESN